MPGDQNDLVHDTSDSDSDSDVSANPPKDSRILLPLERYAKRQQQTANDLECKLNVKRQELAKCREKLNKAAQQNAGNKTVCVEIVILNLVILKRVVTLVPADLLTRVVL